MSEAITILVGTMTGTAQLVADEVCGAVNAAGFASRVEPMEKVDCSVFEPGGVFLIISSTYGNGDVPDNAQALFASLQTERPQISNVVYGVIALGDTTYRATFCNGGLQFDSLLTELGARRVGDPMLHDASSGALAEDVACEWVEEWIHQQLMPALAA